MRVIFGKPCFHLDHPVLLEITGLLARLTIVFSFLYFLRA